MLTRDELVAILRRGKQFVPHGLFTDEAGLAFFMHCSTRTVRAWRELGKGPRALHTTRVVYDLDDIVNWWNGPAAKSLAEDGSLGKIAADRGRS
jgi:hypothetical protein